MKAISQDEHAIINAREYPGTRQLYSKCDQPTGRCEEDSILDEDGNVLCEDCCPMEIIWTNCADEMPPDGCVICRSYVSNGAIKYHKVLGELFNLTTENWQWTPYTPEKWKELNNGRD